MYIYITLYKVFILTRWKHFPVQYWVLLEKLFSQNFHSLRFPDSACQRGNSHQCFKMVGGGFFIKKIFFEDWKIVRARYNPFLAEFFHQPLFSWSVATLGTVNNNAITFTFDRFLHHLLVLTFLHHLLLFTFLHNL